MKNTVPVPEEIRNRIIAEWENGMSIEDLKKKYKMGHPRIRRLLPEKVYKNRVQKYASVYHKPADIEHEPTDNSKKIIPGMYVTHIRTKRNAQVICIIGNILKVKMKYGVEKKSYYTEWDKGDVIVRQDSPDLGMCSECIDIPTFMDCVTDFKFLVA